MVAWVSFLYMMYIRMKRTHAISKPPASNELYSIALTTAKLQIPYQLIGRNIKTVLEQVLSKRIEGVCGENGFVKPESTRILTFSSGTLVGKYAVFEVVYECLTCTVVEGMTIPCVVKNVTSAGIRATTAEKVSPVVVFIARDHHYDRPEFSRLKEEEPILVKVIGQHYELNDKQVAVIGELIGPM